MNLTIEQENYIKSILDEPRKKICFKCGNYQSHARIWCNCGGKFEGEKLTVLDYFRISKHRDLQHVPVVFSPRYTAAIYKRKLEIYGLSEKDFEQYLKEKYDFKESDYRPNELDRN
jgi:hypothetical protein